MASRSKLTPARERQLRQEFTAEDRVKAARLKPIAIHDPPQRIGKTADQRLAELQADRDDLLAENVELRGVIRELLTRLDAIRANAVKGGLAKRKYTAADHSRWKALSLQPSLKRLSKAEKAKRIAGKDKLPNAAVRTIRKHI
jgi:hypothetical protein